ncbi:MAG: hypothetical protein ACK4MD_03100 [Demequina sp.]
MKLVRDSVTLAQGRGNVVSSPYTKVSTSGVYQKDTKANGDGVFISVSTSYYRSWYAADGRTYYGNAGSERIRYGATSSAAWTSRTGQTTSVVGSPSSETLLGQSHTNIVKLCEDRGLLRPDQCTSKSFTVNH